MLCMSISLTMTLGALAQKSNLKEDSEPWVYIIMQHGKMTEVMHNATKPVTRNVTLVNGTTIHPSGVINVSSGRTKRLHEGDYITMDGRIRKLRDMVDPKLLHP
jgi:uncharacterized protein DUF6799